MEKYDTQEKIRKAKRLIEEKEKLHQAIESFNVLDGYKSKFIVGKQFPFIGHEGTYNGKIYIDIDFSEFHASTRGMILRTLRDALQVEENLIDEKIFELMGNGNTE